MKALALTLAAVSILAAPSAFAFERGEHPGLLQIDPEDFGVFEIGALRGGRLGVQVSSMTEELRVAMGAPKDMGILVNRVQSDSAAKKAGIEVGDVIVEVAGEPIDSVGDVWKALSGKDGEVAVEVIREKRRRNLTAKIEKPVERAPLQIFQQNAELQREVEELRAKLKDMERRLEKLEKR
jgi:S1-C subfamily serine protease